MRTPALPPLTVRIYGEPEIETWEAMSAASGLRPAGNRRPLPTRRSPLSGMRGSGQKAGYWPQEETGCGGL